MPSSLVMWADMERRIRYITPYTQFSYITYFTINNNNNLSHQKGFGLRLNLPYQRGSHERGTNVQEMKSERWLIVWVNDSHSKVFIFLLSFSRDVKVHNKACWRRILSLEEGKAISRVDGRIWREMGRNILFTIILRLLERLSSCKELVICNAQDCLSQN